MRQCAVSTIYDLYISESLKRWCKLSIHLVLSELIIVNNIVGKVIQNDIQAMKYVFIDKRIKVLSFEQEKNELHKRW